MPFCQDTPNNPGAGAIDNDTLTSGGTYASIGAGSFVFRTSGPGFRLNDTNQSTFNAIATDVPTEADHYFEVEVDFHSDNGQVVGPAINYSSSFNWYTPALSSDGTLDLIEVVGGTPTTHDTAVVTLSGTHTVGLGRRNSASTPEIYATVDGVEVASFVDTTPRTGPGQAGIYGDAQGATVGDGVGFTVTYLEGLEGSELGGSVTETLPALELSLAAASLTESSDSTATETLTPVVLTLSVGGVVGAQQELDALTLAFSAVAPQQTGNEASVETLPAITLSLAVSPVTEGHTQVETLTALAIALSVRPLMFPGAVRGRSSPAVGITIGI